MGWAGTGSTCGCWIHGTVQSQPAPDAGTSLKLDKPWRLLSHPTLASWTPCPGTGSLQAGLPQQCPAVLCWEQLDHKPPGPDQAFAHEWLSAGLGGQGFTTMVYSAKFPLALREPPWLFAPALRAARSYSCPAGTSQAAHCWDSMGGRVGVQQQGLRRKATGLGSGFTPVPVPAGIHRPAAMPADGRESPDTRKTAGSATGRGWEQGRGCQTGAINAQAITVRAQSFLRASTPALYWSSLPDRHCVGPGQEMGQQGPPKARLCPAGPGNKRINGL